MAVSIRNSSVASFCEEYVLRQAFGFHLTALYTFALSTQTQIQITVSFIILLTDLFDQL